MERLIKFLLILSIIFVASARAEIQTTLSMSTPVLTPGQSGSFSATTVSGPAGSTTSNLVNGYAGVHQYVLSAGTGRFSSLSGTRYGMFFDSFQLFQSFLTNNFFTMVSSASSCPTSGNYTWMYVRWRSLDAPRLPTDVSLVGQAAGGQIAYNSAGSPAYTSSTYFNLAGPTGVSSSYNFDTSTYGGCSSGVDKVVHSGTIADELGRFFFGTNFGFYYAAGGNPLVAILVPQRTLSSGIMSTLANNVLSGIFTGFTTTASQTRQNVYVYPDSNGTTFRLRTINSFSDPTNYTDYATITCTTLNSPYNGFCRGSLTIDGIGGSGNAVCQLGSTSNQDMLSCTMQMPDDNRVGASLVATRSTTSVVTVTVPATAASTAPTTSTTIATTIRNLTGTYVPTLGNPSAPAQQLQAPFSNSGQYAGTGGTCSSYLRGFSSCTMNVTYNPPTVGTSMQTLRAAYDNQSTTVNATGLVKGTSGLVSLAISPNPSTVPTGTSQQLTATATYSDGSIQDVTTAVTWSSNATGVATVSSAGMANFVGTGSVTIGASLAATSTSFSPTVYSPPPNPTGLTPTVNSYTQITLNWTSGGGSTTAFQIAYQTGSNAPADCNSGTVISSGVVGSGTSYGVSSLTPGTTYSFRVCAVGAVAGALSSGVTTTASTTMPHSIFATTTAYRADFGGIYFADFACQQEAIAGSLSGTWRAVIGDSAVAASSHISVTESTYNLRQSGSGGPQLVTTAANFWTASHVSGVQFNATGDAPGSTQPWTGAQSSGAVYASRNCTDWTTASSAVNGQYGATAATNATWASSNQAACNTTHSLYCINLQSNAAAPSNPTGFSTYTVGPTSLGFLWASGGGTTAAYQLAYQTGATAPANCSSGTVIDAATLGLNPTGYTISGLSSSTQYSFRLCAYNSNLTANSSGVTYTASTSASGSQVTVDLTNRQVVFSSSTTTRGDIGGLYFGDFTCQKDALDAGLSGVWKAILGDDSTSALSRISIPGAVYNFRPLGSGGIQQVASDSAGFWSSSMAYPLNYNALGGSPGTATSWTGATAAGAVQTSNNCSNWTTAAAATTGRSGNNSSTGNVISNNSAACNTLTSLYCTNQQSASAAPPDPATFTNYSTASTTVGLSWSSGGGTTAAYQLAYQTGASAPANCTSGTVVNARTLGIAPVSYTVSGLTQSTQYSFRLCALNSDLSSTSAGLTVTVTTLASNQSPVIDLGTKQVVFSTSGQYQGNFGGLYFADFVCQTEANSANLNGTWKAILSDESTSASSRLSIPAGIYNNRPASQGGAELLASDVATFWSVWDSTANYNASGSPPGVNNYAWTGSTSSGGINAGNTCTSWTTFNTAGRGRAANNYTLLGSNNQACNNQYAFYCINQQTASAAPPNPTSFAAYSVGDNEVGFSWASGGGTTAAYQIAYQPGASAPADCTSGMVIPATTIGVNPTTYALTGLSASTQYSFRLCAMNSTLSSASAGTTLTVTTNAASSPPTQDYSSLQVLFSTAASYNGSFGGIRFADFICNREAVNQGISGVWKAVLGDETTSAVSRLSIASRVYNNRPISAGGIQMFADSTTFWTPSFAYYLNYTASGTTPPSSNVYTGMTAAGASKSGINCTSWTTASSGVSGGRALNNVILSTTVFDNASHNCSNASTFYCINQQSADAAPSNPSSFTAPSTTTTSVTLAWASAGGTTAAYQIAYQTGATAPANCTAGTVIPAPNLGVNPTGYTVSGLSPGTQYSFRLCAMNFDLSASSAGVTLTSTTGSVSAIANQTLFSTVAGYLPTFGGLYFADFICQTEATNANVSGIWKAVMSDESTAASSRISLAATVWNNRPAGSGGAQQIATSGTFFGTHSAAQNYNASGTAPSGNATWTGMNTGGAAYAGRTCASWTDRLPGSTGQYGNSNATNATWYTNTTTACNTSRSIYCINQQTASATPSDPTNLSAFQITNQSVGLNWASGGGTTATYQLAYQSGGTAPASCSAGTVVSALTLGTGNPTTYTVVGLSANTQYSFRLCAVNSDLSAMSAGVTVTTTTKAAGAPATYNLGTNQFIFVTNAGYRGNIGGLYFADYACESEAIEAGLGGTWQAILSTSVTDALTRTTLSGPVYNLRPPSAGGSQRVNDANGFWTAIWDNAIGYTAIGVVPTYTQPWTGSVTAGTVAANTCSDWTTLSSATNGQHGLYSSTTTVIGNNNRACNNLGSFYCINQQSAASAPPNPASFTNYYISSSGVGLSWATGGGTTGAYQIAYQTGATAPANCSSGTVIPASALGVNPSIYSVTGLAASTQYSFRLCAMNPSLSASSAGLTLTITTQAAGAGNLNNPGTLQFIFSSNNTYGGNFGGIYFGDFVCQNEASNAGFPGIWKAILSDESTAASSRLTLSPPIYNTRPASSGGSQIVSDGTGFWAGPWLNSTNYTAGGAGTADSSRAWSGTTSATGVADAGNTCSSWTTNQTTSNGRYGTLTAPTTAVSANVAACNNAYALYCINQQTASSAPPNPASFSQASVGSSFATFIWTSGGGTTAAYKLVYQTGATAPANCNSGTIVPPSTLGINPSTYTVSGLSPSTQYSFRLCAMNSDLSSASSGSTVTLTTSSGGTTYSVGTSQFIFTSANTYSGNFGGTNITDFICQTEAAGAGLSGTWKAIMSDDVMNANSRITFATNLYNFRPGSLGGFQRITNGTGFWSGGTLDALWNYNANGSGSSATYGWMGSNTAGNFSANTCSGWITSSSGTNGTVGRNSVYTTYVAAQTYACNSSRLLFCTNQQTSPAAPPNPTGLNADLITNTTVGLSWTSGGGTTATYKLAYQTGATAPANCNSGTIITSDNFDFNAQAYGISGLTASTQYSFRLCAQNSDLSSTSSGTTLSVTTTSGSTTFSPGSNQYMFSTNNNYAPNFGGIYFADYICQAEADTAGLTGIWRALIGDESVAANSHVSVSSRVLTTRPASAKGATLVALSSYFWDGTLWDSPRFNAIGSTPSGTRVWSGATTAGAISATRTCTNWTSVSGAVTGATGTLAATSAWFSGANTACNTTQALRCMNQQTSAASPPDPTSFASGSITTSSVAFTWASGGGTTAAYRLAYQLGSNAPGDCSSGTVVGASTLGVNPTGYTVTGLSSATQYSFRLCATNSDQTQRSSGATLSVTTN